ncbi:hypothetical protein M7775_05940 [Sporomusa sphaeroides DSM 2875]|uniref:hypothetical protein n=1 Tax=Sporomusa sphaeroides TaxID=47679 RepID=UPI00202F54A9|nr:hypothetical protein [Sporomusa sphaeroides]MCM0758116.1 hypothetical protein [Sporomusa sphaeroides DSM 2875]
MSAETENRSFFDLCYAERQFIVVVDDETVQPAKGKGKIKENGLDYKALGLKAFGLKALEVGVKLVLPTFMGPVLIAETAIELYNALNKLKDAGFNALPIARSEAKFIEFPPGHPRNNVLYAAHPTIKEAYFPVAQFHRIVFEHKFSEAIELLMSLGAKRIEVEHVSGWSKDFCAKLDVSIPYADIEAGASISANAKAASKLLFHANLSGNINPKLPENLVWYHHEPTWRQIAQGRLNYGLKDFSLSIRYEDDYGINAGLKMSASKSGLDIGGKFEDHQSTIWRIVGEFN